MNDEQRAAMREKLRLWKEGEFTPTSRSGGPSLPRKVSNFAKAYWRWKAAGKPERTPAQIEKLYAICSVCLIFNGTICTHEDCGCPVRTDKSHRNKLTWATESCPLDPPKWTADHAAPK